MNWTACGALAAVLCLPAAPARAQAEAGQNFDDIAQRARAALQVRPAEAAKLYQQAVTLKPDWAEGWFDLGASLYDLKRYAESRDAFRKETRLNPRMGPGWAFLGMAEAELNEPDQALADIRQGESLGIKSNHPFDLAVRLKAAELLLKTQGFYEAMSQLQSLADGTENSPAVVEAMGLCALAVPISGAELTGEQRAVVDLAGKAAWDLASHRPEEAQAEYRQLLERYPNAPGVHYAYAVYLMDTDLEAALREFETEVRHTPSHWPALILMSTLRIRHGTPELAVEPLRQTLQSAPPHDQWLCHAELARAFLDAGDAAAAVNEAQISLRLRPASPQVHYLLARAYRQQGRAEEAQRETREFERLKAEQDPAAVPDYQRFVLGESGK